jgi:hypothetical protein
MVLTVAGDHLQKPFADLTGAIMLPALKLYLDGFELRNHALLRSNSAVTKADLEEDWTMTHELSPYGSAFAP